MWDQKLIRHAAWWRYFAACVAFMFMSMNAGTASAQDSGGSNNGDTSATVLQPLEIVNLTDLDFGSIIAGNTGGTVIIDPSNDERTVTGGLLEGPQNGAAAQFLTFGGPLQFIFVSRGPLPVLTREGGSETMNVQSLTLNGPVFRFLDEEGLLDLRVGGTLQVGANQAPGTYEGTFQINVFYF